MFIKGQVILLVIVNRSAMDQYIHGGFGRTNLTRHPYPNPIPYTYTTNSKVITKLGLMLISILDGLFNVISLSKLAFAECDADFDPLEGGGVLDCSAVLRLHGTEKYPFHFYPPPPSWSNVVLYGGEVKSIRAGGSLRSRLISLKASCFGINFTFLTATPTLLPAAVAQIHLSSVPCFGSGFPTMPNSPTRRTAPKIDGITPPHTFWLGYYPTFLTSKGRNSTHCKGRPWI